MAKIDFGGVVEEVITSEEFPLEKAREVLKDEIVAVIGYGVQGPGQAMNMRDNGFPVIVGQRQGGRSWQRAVEDGFVPGKTLFPIAEAAKKGTVTLVYSAKNNGCATAHLRRRSGADMAGNKILFEQRRCSLFLSWLFHHLQELDRRGSAGGCGCDHGGSQGFGENGSNQFH